MKKLILPLSAILLCWATLHGCANKPAETSVQSSSVASSSADQADYGQEVSRIVQENGEILAYLRNGMVVIVKRIPSPVITVRGYVMTGGVYEGKWLGGGLSHLLEHLVAGGSNQRRTEEQNRNLLQQIGNDSNAYTYPDHTAYFVNTTPDNLDPAVDLVTGWMLGAKITPAEYAREYEVVQRELEKDNGEPDWVFYYSTVRNRYQVSPSRVPVIGYQEVIRGLSRDDVFSYYQLAYQPNNMVFVVAGNVDPEQMLAAVKKHAKSAPPGRAFSHSIEDEPPVLAPRTLVSSFPKLGQAKLQLAFPSLRLSNPDIYALNLLAAVLGTGESSILVEKLRDELNLVSDIAASNDTPHYVDGTFQVDMELESKNFRPATSAILDLLDKIKTEGIAEDRLKRAKAQIRSARALSQQTAENVGESLAVDYMTTGDPHYNDRYIQRIQAVTNDQIKSVAARYLDRSRLLTTAMLSEESLGKGGLAAAQKELLAARATQTTPQETDSKVTRVELSDGTILLLKRVNTAPVVAIRLLSLGGLTAEDAKTNGLGNLAMNMIPRGTKTRSSRDIAQFFDAIGGDLSTSCANNSWNWSATCLKDDLQKTLPVFLDIVKNPAFPEAELLPIKTRLSAEIKAQDDDWFAAGMRFFRQTYFAPGNSPYQFMALGNADNVEKFTADQARQWYFDKVLNSRRVLAIYGDIDIAQVKALLENETTGPRMDRARAQRQVEIPSPTSAPNVNIRKLSINKTTNPQAAVIIGFDANPYAGDHNTDALTVCDTLASGYGYPTGYIFEILRGRGLVYDANAMIFQGDTPNNPGTFIVYAGCDPKNVDEVIDVIIENIARLQGSPKDIQEEWFDRAKKMIVTSEALHNETAAQQAQSAAMDELLGLGFGHRDSFPQRINNVRTNDVQDAARRLLKQCLITVSTNQPEAIRTKEGIRTFAKFPPVDLTPRGIQHDSK